MSTSGSNRLQPHFVLLCERLNLDKLLPFLRQERMLTNDEYEILTNVAYTKKQQRERLLIILPRKGKYYFENFGKCLVWSGQVELARHIGVDVDNVPPSPYAAQVSGQANTSDSNMDLLDALKGLIKEHSPTGPDPPSAHPPHASPPSYQQASPPTSISHAAGQRPPQQRPYGISGASSVFNPSLAAQGTPYTIGASGVPDPSPGPAPGLDPVAPQPNPAVLPSPVHMAQRPPGSVRLFILYCKDVTLLEKYQTSYEQFFQDVLELADILVSCGGFQSCSVDFYEGDQQQNWNLWTQQKIEESTYVVMVCSPQLLRHLSKKERDDVLMYKGMFFSDTVVNCVKAPKFVPVFLNHCKPANPKDWVPIQLHAASYFWLRNLRELFQDIHAQDYSDLERNQVLFEKLRDPKHKELARLVGYLRDEPDVVAPVPPRIPIQLPSKSLSISPIPQRHVAAVADYIPEETFVKIAQRLPRDWVRLGVKLGVEYSTIERLRHKHSSDYVLAVLEVFRIWQHIAGKGATKRALKRALVDMNFGRLAVECFDDVRI